VSPEPTLGCILAGGASRRMGTDKAALTLAGRPLVAHVAARLAPQCAELVIAGDPGSATLRATGLAVLADPLPGRLGPLAGVLAALRRAEGRYPFVVTTPVDTPFLPDDLVRRLHAGRDGGAIVRAASGGRRHHATALWPASLAADLERALTERALRRVADVQAEHRVAEACWPAAPLDPFENLNTPEDLARAAARLAGR
jgi:molybdopterin-guanine dinucleotide biosynthesis protein A